MRRLGVVAVAALLTLGVWPFGPAAGWDATATQLDEAMCVAPAEPFRPREADLSIKGGQVEVVRVPRTKDNAIGTPSTSARGKNKMGWDPHGKPGSGQGSIILVAHTWPDGSALGNRLLRRLTVGDTVELGGKGGRRACYRVSKKKAYPRAKVPRYKAFRSDGREQLVIVVCSGNRLGPGNWTHRTLWYAEPAVDQPGVTG